jgi:sulfoxide reductase heme-binding subunit YedZ
MRILKSSVFLACLIPFVLLLINAVTDQLGANPLEEIRDTTGIWTLRLLIVTLAITPIRYLTGWHRLIRFRRMIGLFAFFYAALHFITYVWLDQFFAFGGMLDDLTKRRFIMAGYVGFVLMIPLAVTSTGGWIRRLGGKRWQMIHRLIYIGAAAGVVHYAWRVKLDLEKPLLYAVALALLLLWRAFRYVTARRSHPSLERPPAFRSESGH